MKYSGLPYFFGTEGIVVGAQSRTKERRSSENHKADETLIHLTLPQSHPDTMIQVQVLTKLKMSFHPGGSQSIGFRVKSKIHSLRKKLSRCFIRFIRKELTRVTHIYKVRYRQLLYKRSGKIIHNQNTI